MAGGYVLKRIIIVVMVGVVGLFGLFMVVLFTTPCCALQPVVTLESATRNADGTIQILLSTTIDDLDELRVFDQQGNVIETKSTAFEKQVNTYFWQTTIPGHAQQITISTASSLPVGVVVEANVPDWRSGDATDVIRFERAVTVRLTPGDSTNPRGAMLRLTTTEDAFDQLHLYNQQGTRVDSIDTAFVWDAETYQFVWEFMVADDNVQMRLQLRDPLDTSVYVESVADGWLSLNKGIGFERGALPVIRLVTEIARKGEGTELHFVASEPVFDWLYVTEMDGTIVETMPMVFVPTDDQREYTWHVVISSYAERLVVVPVKSESRDILVMSNVATWKEMRVESEIGYVRAP